MLNGVKLFINGRHCLENFELHVIIKWIFEMDGIFQAETIEIRTQNLSNIIKKHRAHIVQQLEKTFKPHLKHTCRTW